jgi:IS1 family transposase
LVEKKTKKENKNKRTEEQETILIERNNLISRHYIEKDGKKTKERTKKKPF